MCAPSVAMRHSPVRYGRRSENLSGGHTLNDWLWTELHHHFDTNDGSLPEVHVNFVDKRAVVTAFAHLLVFDAGQLGLEGDSCPQFNAATSVTVSSNGQEPGLHSATLRVASVREAVAKRLQSGDAQTPSHSFSPHPLAADHSGGTARRRSSLLRSAEFQKIGSLHEIPPFAQHRRNGLSALSGNLPVDGMDTVRKPAPRCEP